jgi:hypothetical protein
MAEHWFRSYHGAPTDPKWITITRKANSVTQGNALVTHGNAASVTSVTPGHVAAIWFYLEDFASQSAERGSLDGLDVEVLADSYGWPMELCQSVVDALRAKGLIDAQNRLAKWDKRQPLREDDSRERVRRHRERQAEAPAAEPPVTQCNAMKRTVTLEENRIEENRIETERTDIEPPPPPPPSRTRTRKREDGEPNDEAVAAAATMKHDLDVETSALADNVARKVRHACASIMDGSDETAWRDPRTGGDGTLVPWADRPRVFRLALRGALSEGGHTAQAISSKIRYEARRQLDPFPEKRPPVGSPAREVSEELPRSTAPRVGRATTAGGVDPELEKRKQEEAELAAIAQWEQDNPEAAHKLLLQAAVAVKQDPRFADLADRFMGLPAQAEYRRRIREQLSGAA